jgi:hypothetical protein
MTDWSARVNEVVKLFRTKRTELEVRLYAEVDSFVVQYDAWGAALRALGETAETAAEIVGFVRGGKREAPAAPPPPPVGSDEPPEPKQTALPVMPWNPPAAAAPPPGPTCPVCGKGCLRVRKTGRTICLDDECAGSRVPEPEPEPSLARQASASGTLRGIPLILETLRREPRRGWTLVEVQEVTGQTVQALHASLGRMKREGLITVERGAGRGGPGVYTVADTPRPPAKLAAVVPGLAARQGRGTKLGSSGIDADETAAVVDAVAELPGRWLTADGVFERIHEPSQWRGGHQARSQLVARIATVLEFAAEDGQLDRMTDEDGRPSYKAKGSRAAAESKAPRMQGTRAPKGQGKR